MAYQWMGAKRWSFGGCPIVITSPVPLPDWLVRMLMEAKASQGSQVETWISHVERVA